MSIIITHVHALQRKYNNFCLRQCFFTIFFSYYSLIYLPPPLPFPVFLLHPHPHLLVFSFTLIVLQIYFSLLPLFFIIFIVFLCLSYLLAVAFPSFCLFLRGIIFRSYYCCCTNISFLSVGRFSSSLWRLTRWMLFLFCYVIICFFSAIEVLLAV